MSLKARLEKLEARHRPAVDPEREARFAAHSTVADALEAALPGEMGFSHVTQFSRRLEFGVSHTARALALAARIEAGNITPEDRVALDGLPVEALDVLGLTAEGFLLQFKRVEEMC